MTKWLPFQLKDDVAMGLGDTVGMAALPHKPALDFMDRYFERLRRSAFASH